MAREYRNFTREEKIKAVKMVLVDKKSQMEVERSVLSSLTEREKIVLSLRYGLDNGEFMSLVKVGEKLNLSSERVRQIEVKALRSLRHPSRARRLKWFLNCDFTEEIHTTIKTQK